MNGNNYPTGGDARKVRRVLTCSGRRLKVGRLAEDEAAFDEGDKTVKPVPDNLSAQRILAPKESSAKIRAVISIQSVITS